MRNFVANFIDEHIGYWFPEFAQRVAGYCGTPFYAALAGVTHVWLRALRSLLDEMIFGHDPSAWAAGPVGTNDGILVVIGMFGGNDGLNQARIVAVQRRELRARDFDARVLRGPIQERPRSLAAGGAVEQRQLAFEPLHGLAQHGLVERLARFASLIRR
mgnify:CR=1 FL=1